MDKSNGDRADDVEESSRSNRPLSVDDAILKELKKDMDRREYDPDDAEKELEYAREKLKEEKRH